MNAEDATSTIALVSHAAMVSIVQGMIIMTRWALQQKEYAQ